MKLRLYTVVLLLALSFHPVNAGCGPLDVFDVCGDIKDEIEDIIKDLAPVIQKAVNEVIDHIFDDLHDFLSDVTAALRELEDHAEEEFEKALEKIKEVLEKIARTVIGEVKDLAKDVTKDVEEIVEEVYNDTSKLIRDTEKYITNITDHLLDRLEKDGEEIFCAVQGWTDLFSRSFQSHFEHVDCNCTKEMLMKNPGVVEDCACSSCTHIGSFYPFCSCNPWDLPSWYNRAKYDLLKCHLLKPITMDWTIQQIINQYSILQGASLSFRCLEDLNPGSTTNREYFSKEYLNYTSEILLLEYNFEVKEASQLKRETEPEHCPTNFTPVQCMNYVLEKVYAAEKELQKAEDDFNNAIKVQTAELKLFYSDECPEGWEEAEFAKGYLLVGRPTGGKTLQRFGRPLDANETHRVGVHNHSIHDDGHAHSASVYDPGHTHPTGVTLARGGGGIGFYTDESFAGRPLVETAVNTTGVKVTVNRESSGAEVLSNDDGEDYPFLHVLVCQKK